MVYVGTDAPIRLSEAAAMLSGAREVGGVLVVHAPTGPADAAGIMAMEAAAKAMRVPLLVCAMGEVTGAGHRRTLAASGIPAFATPEQAVRGFLHLVQDRRNRAAARELPDSTVLEIAPDRVAVRLRLAAIRAESRLVLTREEAVAVLAAYGIAPGASPSSDRTAEARLRVTDDPVFGPAIGFGQGGAVGRLVHDLVVDLPPLNLTLAQALIGRARVTEALSDHHDAIADALVRISQLVVDFPEILTIDIDPLAVGDGGVHAADADITLRADNAPPGWLAIPPYPAELVGSFVMRGQTLTIRPIRPEDAAAHSALFNRLPPEDIRFRFFAPLRELSPERVAGMTQVDYDREMAFVAMRRRRHVRRLPPGARIGGSRRVRHGGRPRRQGQRPRPASDAPHRRLGRAPGAERHRGPGAGRQRADAGLRPPPRLRVIARRVAGSRPDVVEVRTTL